MPLTPGVCPGHGVGWTRDYSTDEPGVRWVCAKCHLPSRATAIRLGEIERD